MDFKVMLRNYLIENGLTQEQFGEMVGVTGPAVNTWVLGKRKPTINRAVKIAEVLGKPQEEILFMLGYISNPSSDKLKGLMPEQSLTWI
jgi:transcriptional regulator with XRE-family HTH domain